MEKVGMFLLLCGLILIIGYGGYHLILGLISLEGVPVIVKVALIMIAVGIILLLVKLIWERVKGGRGEDVDRKY